MTALSFIPAANSLNVDDGENSVYLVSFEDPGKVIVLNASNGVFLSAQQL